MNALTIFLFIVAAGAGLFVCALLGIVAYLAYGIAIGWALTPPEESKARNPRR